MRLFSVPLMEDESLTSFTSRFAWANARTAIEFCQDFGFSFRSVIAGNDDAVTRLSELSGINHQLLDSAAVKRCGDKTVWVAGEETPFMFYMRGVLKFCPACFAEDELRDDIKPRSRKYIRKSWYSRFIRTCPVHCQSLASAGTHGQPDHIHDLCWSLDYLRREVAVASREVVDQPFTAFEEYVTVRLRGGKPGNDFLDPLPLFVAGDVCELAGMVALHGKDVTISDKSDRQRWEAGAKGFEIFKVGTAGLHRFIDDLYRRHDSVRASHGGNELFGKFHEILANKKADPAYEPVKDAVRSYAFENLPLTDTTILFGKGGDAKFISLNSIHKRYGVSDRLLRKYLMKTGGITTLPGTDIPAIAAADVGRLVALLNDLVRATEAAKMLGVTISAFNLLVGNGLVSVAVPKDEDAEMSERYSRRALDEFLHSLLAKANTTDVDGLMSIKAVGRSLRATLISILHALIRGDLKSVGIDSTKSGIMSLLLAVDEVETALTPARSTEPEEDHLTVTDLSKLLQASPNSIYQFLARGLIETGTIRNAVTSIPQRVIAPEVAGAFRERYVSLAECCRRSGLHSAAVRHICMAAGLERAFPREELREVFYLRAEAELALSDAVPEWNRSEGVRSAN
ncbi:TniQ family protein [Agrobacterium sp. 22-214-1]